MIRAAVCTGFKQALLARVADDVYLIALYTAAAALSQATPAYRADGEVPASGSYQPGGLVLEGVHVAVDGDTATLTWTTDALWTDTTIAAAGALIYNRSQGNRAVAVLDFEGVETSRRGPFRVTLPPAVVRLA